MKTLFWPNQPLDSVHGAAVRREDRADLPPRGLPSARAETVLRHMHNHVLTRRSFLQRLGAAGWAAPFITRGLIAAPPSGRLRHASFGASGMAWADLGELARSDAFTLVAVAEVDLGRAADVKKRFPECKVYQDWRQMLDQEHKNIDSVNVSTPDHMHAPMGMSALQLGKHMYGQKPLAHDLYEVRRLTEVARQKGVVTQMGIQIHSAMEYRLAVRLVQDLVIGKIKEVHTWSGKKWGDPTPRPDRSDPVPEGFNWDFWLGVAATRPFLGGGYYHPGNWRKRLDFGTGTFGDMGCHIYDPVFKALDLTAPLSVRSEGPVPNAWNWADNALIRYLFPGTRFTAGNTVKVTWYDGDQRPPRDVVALIEGDSLPDQGSIFMGAKGVMLLPHIAPPQLYPEATFKDFRRPKVESHNHWLQFVEACRGNGQTAAGFDYSGPLTEAVLLGGVATRFPQTTLEWNARALKFNNVAEANPYLRRTYRQGWEVKGLS
jgi:predicted dehydrogenase